MVKNHKADSFDGGRAASVAADPDPVSRSELSRRAVPGANAHPDDDVHALLLAALALASANE